MRLLLVIIDDLHFVRVPFPPFKTDPIAVVDANAVLAFPVPLQRLQTESWQTQVVQAGGRVQQRHAYARGPFNRLELAAELTVQEVLRLLVPTGPDHTISIIRDPYKL